jgi:Concanavalin A-like lectin/glucanases superfamily
MIDPYLLSAPILLLGIVALLRFVGCGFSPTATAPTAPTLGAPEPGNGEVKLTWTETDMDKTGYSYQVNRSNDNGPVTVVAIVTDPDTTYTDKMGLTNGTTYTYTVTLVIGGILSGTSNPVNATPALLPGRPLGFILDPHNDLWANLIGLFLMNEGTGLAEGQPADDTNLVDGKIASHSGPVAATWEVTDPSIVFHGGPSGTCFLDAGVDAAFADMPTNKITIVAKVWINALTPGGFCEKNDGGQGSSDSGFLFGVTSSGALHFTMELSIQHTKIETNPNTVAARQWVQVAFTWDGTQPTAPASAGAIFVNGALQPNAIATTGNGAFDVSRASNSRPFRIGNASYSDVAGSFYGKIAYMAIYNGRLLMSSEMMALDALLIKAG